MFRHVTFALAVATTLIWFNTSSAAEKFHGRLSLTDLGAFQDSQSLDALLGNQNTNDLAGDGRLEWNKTWGKWSLSVAYQFLFDLGGSTRQIRSRNLALQTYTPPATLFNLTNVFVDRGNTLIEQRLDRLSLAYSTPDYVVRIGRQALTWGAGVVFHPMDLIDPFPPNALDTEFKPGVDMLYAQWLLADGSNLEVAAVPRAANQGGAISLNTSTFAVHFHKSFGEYGTSWLVAMDNGGWTFGFGLSGPLRGAIWNLELVPTVEADGVVRTSGIANIATATTIFGRDATVYLEYFRNGFGARANGTPVKALPADLVSRLNRGQVFNTSRDYLAGGITLNWTPLVSVSPRVILNLDDRSFYLSTEARWSVSDNATAIAGVEIPVGPRHTEFGGLPVVPQSGPYYETATAAYVELRYYF